MADICTLVILVWVVILDHTLQTISLFVITLARNDLLSRLYWGTQWTMEIS